MWTNGAFELDDRRKRQDMDQPSAWARAQYWLPDRTHQQVLDAWGGAAVVFGLYKGGALAGGARVVTDRVTIAYLADVYIATEHRGAGIGAWMIERIVAHADLQTVAWLLHTRNAHGLYRRAGFEDASPRILERPRRRQ